MLSRAETQTILLDAVLKDCERKTMVTGWNEKHELVKVGEDLSGYCKGVLEGVFAILVHTQKICIKDKSRSPDYLLSTVLTYRKETKSQDNDAASVIEAAFKLAFSCSNWAAITMSDGVETFRRISWLIFKWLLWAMLGIVMLVSGAIGIYYGYNWYTYDRHVAKIIFTVEASNENCSTNESPLRVTIENKSSRPVHKFSFHLGARIRGHSSDIASYQDYEDDFIIEPGHTAAACFSMPTFKQTIADPKELIWSVESKSITFGDWMRLRQSSIHSTFTAPPLNQGTAQRIDRSNCG
jgi:hypothetical protein